MSYRLDTSHSQTPSGFGYASFYARQVQSANCTRLEDEPADAKLILVNGDAGGRQWRAWRGLGLVDRVLTIFVLLLLIFLLPSRALTLNICCRSNRKRIDNNLWTLLTQTSHQLLRLQHTSLSQSWRKLISSLSVQVC